MTKIETMTNAQFREAALQQMNHGERWTIVQLDCETPSGTREFTGKVNSIHDDGFMIQNGGDFLTMGFPDFSLNDCSGIVSFRPAQVS